jgi:PBSX family phage portal protein
MAKKKLIKRGNPTLRQTKTIPVQDVNGNKHILRATVIGVETKNIRKERSSAIVDEDIYELGFSSKVVKPPLSQSELAVLSEYSGSLGQNLDAMAIGVEGFGQRIMLDENLTEAQEEFFKTEINTERRWLETHLMKNPNPSQTLKELRKQLQKDKQATGNAWLELVPGLVDGMFSCYNRIEPSNMWIVKADNKFTRIAQKYVNENYQLKEKTFLVRLRKYVQIVGKKKVFFKEFRDPRPIHAGTGEVLRERNIDGKPAIVDSQGKKVPRDMLARELYHFKIPTTRRTPYGMPSYAGNIIAIKGSRSGEESNILTLQNNNVPSMAVMVSGGMLTDGSIERLQEFVDTSIKGDLNYSKFLILEGESNHDALSGASSMKIEIKPLTNEQHTDALWDKYDDKNNAKIRRGFRQPPVMVGETEEITRDSAQTSEKMAEKYVYNPERESIDECWNQILVQQGIRFHKIKGQSPNVTNDEDLVKILSTAEKTGGITPRIAHMILEDVLNRKLPALIENDPDFNPDLPFSISVGKLARGMARSNSEGTLAPKGQEEGDKGEDKNPDNQEEEKSIVDVLHDSIDPHKALLDAMESILDIEAFGEIKRDYFKHEH